MTHYLLEYTTEFDSAHKLPWHKGKCKNLHGHRWQVKIKIGVNELDKNGMVIDFHEIKDTVKQLDHMYLNSKIKNPTAENISKWIYKQLNKKIKQIHTLDVQIWESEGASITYQEL